jgi:hypothetical protein
LSASLTFHHITALCSSQSIAALTALKSFTHAGIPWLRYIRERRKDRVHFRPFDGWNVPPGRSVVAEVYPALWNTTFPTEGRTPDRITLPVVGSSR